MAFNFFLGFLREQEATALVTYIRMELEVWGHSDVWLEISHWPLQEKSCVILRVDMQIEKSNYFSGDKNIWNSFDSGQPLDCSSAAHWGLSICITVGPLWRLWLSAISEIYWIYVPDPDPGQFRGR